MAAWLRSAPEAAWALVRMLARALARELTPARVLAPAVPLVADGVNALRVGATEAVATIACSEAFGGDVALREVVFALEIVWLALGRV
jgi:hypothetical protein